MRCNRVLEPLPVVPDLFTYMGNAIGRTVHDTPDAWCWLRENYVLRVGAVKNFEHWLYQRDSIGYTTTPVLKIQHAIDEWMCPWNGEFDNIARCGSKIGFQLDTAFFRVGVHKVAIKISYQDIAGGSLDLVFNDSVQVQQHRTILTTGTNMIKTATFFVAPNFYSSIGKYDFELQSESQVPVVLVRVVKDAPLNVNTEIDQSVDNKKPSISIYPIPVKNILHITSDIEGQIMIINSVGQLVYNSYFKDVNAVDTSSFPSGVYTVFIKGKFEQGKIRFVK